MVQIGRYVYEQAPTGDWLVIGKVVKGIDGYYIQLYK